MSIRKTLEELIATLPESQQRQVLDFARFLQLRQEQQEWEQLGAEEFAAAYGPDEPEYTEADLKPDLNS